MGVGGCLVSLLCVGFAVPGVILCRLLMVNHMPAVKVAALLAG